MIKSFYALAAAAALLGAVPAHSTTILYTGNGSQGSQPVAASVLFSLTGNQLTVVVVNASGGSTSYTSADMLTAVYFASTALNLTAETASTTFLEDNNGGTVCSGSCDVGVGWDYATFASPIFGAMNAISVVGTAATPWVHNFSGGAPSHGSGGDYAVAPAGYAGSSGNSAAGNPVENNSVAFTFQTPSDFSLSSVNAVDVQFGQGRTALTLSAGTDSTALNGVVPFVSSDPVPGAAVTALPEPSSLLLLSGALFWLAGRRIYARR